MILPASLQRIVDDNLSGSVTLLKRLMIVLENELIDPDIDPATFLGYIEQIRNKMNSFTVIRHFCDELMLSHNLSVSSYPNNYLNFLKEYEEFWEYTPQLLLNNLLKVANLEKRTVMLHSNSGTIREVFRLLAEKKYEMRIIQTLSAPAEEGRIQAHDLANMGFKVTLITDASAAEKLKNCHYLILGADQIRGNSIVNKTGSLQMILAAQELDVPVIVLTESRKTSFDHDDELAFKDVSRDKKEILLDEISHPNIDAENIYFEEIPTYLISHMITEKKSSE